MGKEMKSEGGQTHLVLGMGNILLKDDGLGVWLIRELQKKELPEGVQALEVGIDLFAAAYLLRGSSRVLVIDAVRGGGEPGTIYRLSREDVEGETNDSYTNGERLHSLHDLRLPHLLHMSSLTKGLGHIEVFGVEPDKIETGHGLTPKLNQMLPQLGESLWEETWKMVG